MQELISKQNKYMDKKYFREFYMKDNRFHQLIFETVGEKRNPSDIDNYVKMVATIRKRDVEGMRKVVLEDSNSLLERAQSMAKKYPHFFSK